jgi:hypothetical protein
MKFRFGFVRGRSEWYLWPFCSFESHRFGVCRTSWVAFGWLTFNWFFEWETNNNY